MSMTRRSFLKGAAAGALGLASMGIVAPVAPAKAEGETKWDAEYDVLVVGYGAAGANAAIVAADKGAKVLLTEKCPEGQEGGNTKYSGQGLQCFEGKENAIVYYKSLRGLFNTPSDAVIEAYADKIEEIKTICWCGRKATMVARLVNGNIVKQGEQIVIGGNDMYVSLCRKHYNDGRLGPDR